jgi:hypothetical protein
MLNNLKFIIDFYCDILQKKIDNYKPSNIKVVEFYINKEKFFVDIDNNIYILNNNFNNKVMGEKVGYLKNRTIYLE